MRLTNVSKKVVAVAMTVAVTASSIVVAPAAPKKAEAASYKAYLCMMTAKYATRSNHNDDGNFFNYLVTEQKEKIAGTKFKDVTMKTSKKAKTYTVSLTGLNGAIANDGGWNTIYVDTSIPGTAKKKIKVTKAVLKFDGKVVKTIKNPVLTPDPGKSDPYTQIMVLNGWNTYAEKKCKAASIKKMPKNSISVTFTVKSLK